MNEFLRQVLFLPLQRSTVAQEIDSLHYAVILATMAGAALVALVAGGFLIRYRRRGRDVHAPHLEARVQIPLAFEVASVVLLFVLFVLSWVVGTRQYVRLRIAPTNALDVYVTAKQWMWKFAYPNGNKQTAQLYVPTGRPVKLIMTSRDVIHSFYVPDFRVKQDVVPGRYTTVWFEAKAPGAYPIFCTEYCGVGHSIMRGEVIALEASAFDRWVAGGSPTAAMLTPEAAREDAMPATAAPEEATPAGTESLAQRGERVAGKRGCLRCHTLDGSPYIGPTWAGLDGAVVPLEGGGEAQVDEGYLTESMMDPAVKIHRGFQNVMPSYLGKLAPPEVAAILELIKSLRTTPPLGPSKAPFGPLFDLAAPLPERDAGASLFGLPGEVPVLPSPTNPTSPPSPPSPEAPPPGVVTPGGQPR